MTTHPFPLRASPNEYPVLPDYYNIPDAILYQIRQQIQQAAPHSAIRTGLTQRRKGAKKNPKSANHNLYRPHAKAQRREEESEIRNPKLLGPHPQARPQHFVPPHRLFSPAPAGQRKQHHQRYSHKQPVAQEATYCVHSTGHVLFLSAASAATAAGGAIFVAGFPLGLGFAPAFGIRFLCHRNGDNAAQQNE